MSQSDFHAFVVRDCEGSAYGAVERLTEEDLPPGDVLIKVHCSSLNFKDALACEGDRRIAPQLPHVPGIDLAGVVLRSDSPDYRPGDRVLVTGYELGAPRWGGFSARARVPAEWVVPLPDRFSAEQAMLLGTAGFTAAQCVMAVTERIAPDDGEVLVTGATGGVGSLSIALLTKLGYRVVAISGKPHLESVLRSMGVVEVMGRETLTESPDRPLLSGRWAGAIDTVGGKPLTTLVRSLCHRGIVAACGLVAGDQLPLTVYPFLLRGVTLAGIDSANCPAGPRQEVWRRLMGPWQVDLPVEFVSNTTLSGLPERVTAMRAGLAVGRTLVIPKP